MEKFGVIDEISYVHRDKNGKVIKRYKSNNWKNRLWIKLHLKKHQLMTNEGFAQVAAYLLHDVDLDHGTYKNCDLIAIGSGTIPADPADYNLGVQQGTFQPGAGSRITVGGVTNNTAQLIATFSQAIDPTLTGTDLITEVGMFWDTTSHAMLMRQVFAAESMNWDAGDSIEMTVKVQVKQGT